MTDNDVIKALECCINSADCEDCYFKHLDAPNCGVEMDKKALDLINRLQAEIERLKSRNKFLEIEFKNNDNLFRARVNGAKSEAIKEFAERLKEKMYIKKDKLYYSVIIDNLLEELEKGGAE